MHILIVYPSVNGLKNGNLVTAERWQTQFLKLNHNVEIAASFDDAIQRSDAPLDLMIALHAVKSAASIQSCSQSRPDCPIIVVLTGTDIYDAQSRPTVEQSLEMADQIVVLQTATADDVPDAYRKKVDVIFQSVAAGPQVSAKTTEYFDVCVVGHLRPVKDPFQIARATRNLPKTSRIRATQIGGAMTDSMRLSAQTEASENDRYRWVGEVCRDEAKQRIADSDLLVNTSKVEGGAAVICEAVVAGTPILASRIAGNVGFLGDDYVGLFDFGDTNQLRELLLKAESDEKFYQRLKQQCESRKHLFDPDFERRSWEKVLEKIER